MLVRLTISSMFVTVHHRSPPFVTVRHRSSPFVTVRHRSSLFVTVRHRSSPFVTVQADISALLGQIGIAAVASCGQSTSDGQFDAIDNAPANLM